MKNGGLEGTRAWGYWNSRNGWPKLLGFFEELWAPQIIPYTRSMGSTWIATIFGQSLGHESGNFHGWWPRAEVGNFRHLFHHETISERGSSQSIWVKADWGKCDHATCITLPRSTQIKKWQDKDYHYSGSYAENVTVDHQQSGWGPSTAWDQQAKVLVCYQLHGTHYT